VKCVAGSVERLSGLVEVQVVDEDDALLVHKWYVSQRNPGGRREDAAPGGPLGVRLETDLEPVVATRRAPT
jgi:hypothetical protein